MNIIEAIKSGKRFKLSGDSNFHDVYSWGFIGLSRQSIMAEDWELEPEPKKKVKMYQYAYTSDVHVWQTDSIYFRDDKSFVKHFMPSHSFRFKRLDHTMIEVDE